MACLVGLACAGGWATAPRARAQTSAAKVATAGAGAPGVAPVPSSSAAAIATAAASEVDESEPPPIPTPTRTVAGWRALWDEGTKGSFDLRVAVDEIERAEAATRVAWAGVLPTAAGNVTLGYATTSNTLFAVLPTGTSLSAELVIAAPLVNLRNAHAIGTAHVSEDMARLSLDELRRRFALNLARSLLSIAAARRLSEVDRVGLEAALERLALTKARVGIGVGDARDLMRAQQDVASARAVIPGADEALRKAREGMSILLGQRGELGVGGETVAIEAELAGFCAGGAVDAERADVRVAKRQVVVAERNVDDVLLLFAPTLTAQVNVGTLGAPLGGPYENGWSLSAVLTVPIYDGGARYGEKRDRVALVDEARVRRAQVEVEVATEVAQARREIDVARAAERSARESRDLAAKIDEAQRAAYSIGASGTTNFDLIEAGRILRQAEGLLVLRELDLARARASLPFIAGSCAGLGPRS